MASICSVLSVSFHMDSGLGHMTCFDQQDGNRDLTNTFHWVFSLTFYWNPATR